MSRTAGERIYHSTLITPFGKLLLVASATGLREIRFENDRRPALPDAGWVEGGPIIDKTTDQLTSIFDGMPQRWTMTMALVRGVIFASTSSGSRPR